MMKCEIGGCYRTPVEKAHIWSKGAGGSIKPHNRINLCVYHHRTGDKSIHNIGTKAFGELHGLTERFQKAYETEWALERERRKLGYQKIRTKQAVDRKRYCPTCHRRWSKGVIKGEENGRQ